jgi:hypothetical protein
MDRYTSARLFGSLIFERLAAMDIQRPDLKRKRQKRMAVVAAVLQRSSDLRTRPDPVAPFATIEG